MFATHWKRIFFTRTPHSSIISLLAQAANDSPSSRLPPAKHHVPAPWLLARRPIRTLPRFRIITPMPTLGLTLSFFIPLIYFIHLSQESLINVNVKGFREEKCRY